MSMIDGVNHHKKNRIFSYCFDVVSIFITTFILFAGFISCKLLITRFCPFFLEKIVIFQKPFIYYAYLLIILYFVITLVLTTVFHIRYMFIFNANLKSSQNDK